MKVNTIPRLILDMKYFKNDPDTLPDSHTVR